MKIIVTESHYNLFKITQILNEGPGVKGFLELLTTNTELIKKALKDIKLTEFRTVDGKYFKNTNEIINAIKNGEISSKELGRIRKSLFNSTTSPTSLKDVIALDVAKWLKKKHSDLKTDSEIIAFLRGNGFKDGDVILQQYKLLTPKVKTTVTSTIKPKITRSLLTTQQINKLKNIFNEEQMKNIEQYFKYLVSDVEKVAVIKNNKLYLKTSDGVEIPSSTVEQIMDMSLSGKINSSNLESFLSKIPEKLLNGHNFRDNMKKLLSGIIKNEEKNIKKPIIKQEETISSSFKMAKPEESFKLAGWLDQKFYESGGKRLDDITNVQFEKMLPETKEYLKKLYQRMKELFPSNPNSRISVKTDQDAVKAVTSSYWGGFGRQGKLVGDNASNIKNTPSLPIPSKSVENNLNSIFPTESNSQYASGKNFWSSSN